MNTNSKNRANRCFTEMEEHDSVAEKAIALLASHPYFHDKNYRLFCEIESDGICLQGIVPSFYLKQVAQEVLRQYLPESVIVNKIVVANPK